LNKTSFFQKAALILFGLILTVILLEAGLRLGGFVLSSIQEYRNKVSMSQRGTYRIMCLGESTTARRYPPFLEEILNQRNSGIKFSVIDKGFVGTTTDIILSAFESNLDTYHPDMVITMMGINDHGAHLPYETISGSKVVNFLRSCRIYKLARLLWLHIVTRLKEFKESDFFLSRSKLQQVPAEEKKAQTSEALSKYEEMIKLGNSYRDQIELPKAEEMYRKAVELNPKNETVYRELAGVCRWQGKYSEAEESFKKAIAFDPKNAETFRKLGDIYHEQRKFSEAARAYEQATKLNPTYYEAYFKRGDTYKYQGKYSDAEKAYKKAIELEPKNYRAYPKLGMIYQKQGRFPEAVELFKGLIELNPNDHKALGSLGVVYGEMGNSKLAEEYGERAREIRLSSYNPNTVDNYRKLKRILDKRGITYVCVQYPMRDVESLERIFRDDAEGIIFVDNERLFKDAVQKDGYREYFRDMFGGDFGHCTKKGDRLLAENIANAILKEAFNR